MRDRPWIGLLVPLLLGACTSGEEKSCENFCNAPSTCTNGVCVPPACQPACEAGFVCAPALNQCVPAAPKSCEDFCTFPNGCVEGACTAPAAKTCADFCFAPSTCVDGRCVAPGCQPACGEGLVCDLQQNACIAREPRKCEDFCKAPNACVDGECLAPACQPACGEGLVCDVTNNACVPREQKSCEDFCSAPNHCVEGRCIPATCQPACGAGSTCDPATNSCVSTALFHRQAAALKGPFTTGWQVTAACLTCHQESATEFMATTHWRWKGATPRLVKADGTPLDTGAIGKVNLINNFCVAVATNDKRCDQCHAGYGGDPDAAKSQKSARAYAKYDPADATSDSSIPLAQRIDCLVCHSNPAAGYTKDPKNFGNPASAVNLATAAKEIQLPNRTNCGSCHFYAGGADSVKVMGSQLKNPSVNVDVHMGRDMGCNECHASTGHEFRGIGTHVPTGTTRAACEDCHGSNPHTGKFTQGEVMDAHNDKIACQTCHIPNYGRAQHQKVDWDWSTVGNNTRGSLGVVTTKVNDAGEPDAAGVAVTAYDYIKGDFKWGKAVRPVYAWSNGRMTHALASDKMDFGTRGLTPDDATRITLAAPVGTLADGKIFPYKLMRGRQAVYVDGANSFVIVPNLFGPSALWGLLQAPGYTYTGESSVEALWSTAFATGASKAGQLTLAAGQTALPKRNPDAGVNAGWEWRYTQMYLDLNHEVAPKALALGAGGKCADCHSASPRIPLCELYRGETPPMGVTCN